MTTAIMEQPSVQADGYTQAQIAHRRACAYLKGILCGYADRKGHKYHTTKELTPDFEVGFKEGLGAWADRDAITGTHILHNWLRNRPPHAGGTGYTAWARGNLNMHLGDLAGELEGLLDG